VKPADDLFPNIDRIGPVELIEYSRPPGDRRLFWPRQRGLRDQASLIELAECKKVRTCVTIDERLHY
jgi:hypothetical protein